MESAPVFTNFGVVSLLLSENVVCVYVAGSRRVNGSNLWVTMGSFSAARLTPLFKERDKERGRRGLSLPSL